MPRTHIAIIGAPLDLGQDRRGVDMGPSAVRVANLHARVVRLGCHAQSRAPADTAAGGVAPNHAMD